MPARRRAFRAVRPVALQGPRGPHRPPPSYSIETAREIHEAFPQARLFWLIGHDQWAQIGEWREAEALRRLVDFIRFPRGETALPRREPGVMDLPRPRRVDISASEIRRRVKARLPIDHLVPDAVAARIRRYRLYQS
jgi:nicotinate-nucleotide adenylyltransferase